MLKWLIYTLVLRQIIRRDYKLRCAGIRPDRWHWADKLACEWGHFTQLP